MSDRRTRLESAGQWLREQRERRGYRTLAQFAQALGVDQSMVSRYERGVSEVDDERAAQIAGVLGIDLITTRRRLGLWVPEESPPPRQDAGTAEALALIDALQDQIAELRERLEGAPPDMGDGEDGEGYQGQRGA